MGFGKQPLAVANTVLLWTPPLFLQCLPYCASDWLASLGWYPCFFVVNFYSEQPVGVLTQRLVSCTFHCNTTTSSDVESFLQARCCSSCPLGVSPPPQQLFFAGVEEWTGQVSAWWAAAHCWNKERPFEHPAYLLSVAKRQNCCSWRGWRLHLTIPVSALLLAVSLQTNWKRKKNRHNQGMQPLHLTLFGNLRSLRIKVEHQD